MLCVMNVCKSKDYFHANKRCQHSHGADCQRYVGEGEGDTQSSEIVLQVLTYSLQVVRRQRHVLFPSDVAAYRTMDTDVVVEQTKRRKCR